MVATAGYHRMSESFRNSSRRRFRGVLLVILMTAITLLAVVSAYQTTSSPSLSSTPGNTLTTIPPSTADASLTVCNATPAAPAPATSRPTTPSLFLERFLNNNNVGHAEVTGTNTNHVMDIPQPSSYHDFSSDLDSFRRHETEFCVLLQAIDMNLIQQIRSDSTLLQKLGYGDTASIAKGAAATASDIAATAILAEQDIRRGVHQIWLKTCQDSQPLTTSLGNVSARQSLYKLVEALRMDLESGSSSATPDDQPQPDNHGNYHHRRVLPSHLTELSYLSYRPGAFYKAHVDRIASRESVNHNDKKNYDRCVSWLLYLGDPSIDLDDDHNDDGWDEDHSCANRSWDPLRDGGCLRIYHDDDDVGDGGTTQYTDITPHPGTLILFDSATVRHEVLVTNRPRSCVVGWFNTITIKQ
jgi:predicted 2-oxoglutarate/Fe(II)-dependent dioxygenase YbiX